MAAKSKIIEIIYENIDEINEQNGINIPKDINARLFGRESELDSLGLVNLIINIEEKVNEVYNTSITIANEKAMSQKNSPFRTVETLAEYVDLLIKEEQNG